MNSRNSQADVAQRILIMYVGDIGQVLLLAGRPGSRESAEGVADSLWLVRMKNSLPSNMRQKCQIAA